MKKSLAVRVPLVSTLAAAALAAGCGSSQPAQPAQAQGWQTCVDRAQGTAVSQQYCDGEAARTSTPGYMPHYFWYYYPRSYYWDAPTIGGRVPIGGTYSAVPFSSAPMARTGAVVRGGLGSTAAGHTSAGE
jgi:hypothetical protein